MFAAFVNLKLAIVGPRPCPRLDVLLLHVLDEHNPGPELLHLLPPLWSVLLRVHNGTEDNHVILTHLPILMCPEDVKDAVMFPLNQRVILWIQLEDCMPSATSVVATFVNEGRQHRLLWLVHRTMN